MKIIDRYLIRESFIHFAISLLAFVGILLTLRILKLANLIINKGVEFQQIALVFAAIIPSFLEIAVPLAALLGIMLAFARLSGDSEIVVLRASGVSLNQLMKPIAVLSAFLLAFGMYVSFELRPWGYQKLSQVLFSIASSKGTAGLSAGVFNKLGDLTLYAEEIDHKSGRLERVIIDDKRQADSRKIVTAASGSIVSNERDQTLTLNLRNGSIHEIAQENKYVLTRYVRNSLVMEPEHLQDGEKHDRRTRELSAGELREQLQFLQSALDEYRSLGAMETSDLIMLELPGEEAKEYTVSRLQKKVRSVQIEIVRKYSMPFAAVVLAFIAVPLGIQPPRTQRAWGVSLSAVLALVVFVLYYGIFSLAVALSESGVISPYIGLWIPNLVCLGIAGFMLQHMAAESWQSVAEAAALKLEWLYSGAIASGLRLKTLVQHRLTRERGQ